VEHAYQSEKSALFGLDELVARLRDCPTAAQAKRMGGEVPISTAGRTLICSHETNSLTKMGAVRSFPGDSLVLPRGREFGGFPLGPGTLFGGTGAPKRGCPDRNFVPGALGPEPF